MDKEIRFIDNAINEIVNDFGIKRKINQDKIIKLIRKQNYDEAFTLIAQQLGLPISIEVVMVPKNSNERIGDQRFYSTGMTPSYDRTKESIGIIAQVEIPNYVPQLGSNDLKKLKVKIRIGEILRVKSTTLITAVAHELAHVLLKSARVKYKESERHTDLTVIVFGFHEIFRDGRKYSISREVERTYEYKKVQTTTYTFGYLNDLEFKLAFGKIFSINFKKNDEIKKLYLKLISYIKNLKFLELLQLKFNAFLELHLKNLNVKIKTNDLKHISEIFKDDYNVILNERIFKYNTDFRKINKFYKKICDDPVFKLTNYEIIEKNINTIDENLNEIIEVINKTQDYIKVLKKYTNIKDKINYSLNQLINKIKNISLKKKIFLLITFFLFLLIIYLIFSNFKA